MAAETDRSYGERREMIRVIGKPSRLKDGIGVAALAGTALLYAFQGPGRQQTEECLGCEISEVTPAVDPAAEPAQPESLLSTGSRDAAAEGHADSALPAAPVTAASHLLEKAHLQREAH